MADRKPDRASLYRRGTTDRVRAACLHVATKLGDLADEIVVVGGLVPSLIVDQQTLPVGAEAHVGTMDLDLALSLALLDEERYRTVAERLRNAGFAPDRSPSGATTRQRWRAEDGSVTVDYLIPASSAKDRGGSLRNLERDFAAVIVPGVQLAFRNRKRIAVRGTTLAGERAERIVGVCGAGAFAALKALAFDGRGENKDAYDLAYLLRTYGTGVDDVAAEWRPLLDDADARRAVEVLRRDFLDPEAVGPRRAAAFLGNADDVDARQDLVGLIRQLISSLGPAAQ